MTPISNQRDQVFTALFKVEGLVAANFNRVRTKASLVHTVTIYAILRQSLPFFACFFSYGIFSSLFPF